jgi:hypothetical protein
MPLNARRCDDRIKQDDRLAITQDDRLAAREGVRPDRCRVAACVQVVRVATSDS